MHSFVDQQQREWQLAVTTWTVKQVREQTGVMLPSLFDDECRPLGQLAADYVKLVDVCWVLCQKQAETKAVGPEEFYGAMYGDSLRAALEALVRATADFFTSPEQRESLNKIISLILETSAQVGVLAGQNLTEVVEQIDTAQLASSCLDFVLSGQGSPELSRGDSPPVNSA